MKRLIPKRTAPKFNNSIEYLHQKTQKWASEIEFIRTEQEFLRELLSDHVIGLCKDQNYSKAKLFLNGIEHEYKLGEELIQSIKDHTINLALLIENIYLKREDDFRKNHEVLKSDVENYIDSFKYIKGQVFKLVLSVLKENKRPKLLIEKK